MSGDITLKYGTYTLTPTPLVSINKTLQSLADGTVIGEDWQLTLDGTLTTLGLPSGLPTIRSKQDDLLRAFSENGKLLLLTCNSTVLMSGYPIVNEVSIPEGNWVFQSPYTISLQLNELPQGSGSGFLADASEEWTLDFDDSQSQWSWTLPGATGDAGTYMLRLNHSLSATGKPRYTTSSVTPAWQNARDFCIQRLGRDNTFVTHSGVLNLNANQLGDFDHIRSVNANEAGGSYGVTETWLIRPTGVSGVPTALEDFTISIRQGSDSVLNTVSIEGNIQGLETRTYGTNPGDFTVSTTKYASASGSWAAIKDRLLGRANLLLDSVSTIRDINPIPLASTVGHHPHTGNISYTYEYDDRPTNCITGARTESITITDNYATDVFARFIIPGRAVGELLQDLNTTTAPSRELTIEAVMSPATGCPSSGNVSSFFAQRPDAAIDTIVNAIEGDLLSAYSQVFKTTNQRVWDPKEGRISAQVAWTYQNCE